MIIGAQMALTGLANCSEQAKSTIQHTIVSLDRSTFKGYQLIRSTHYISGTGTQLLIYTIAKRKVIK